MIVCVHAFDHNTCWISLPSCVAAAATSCKWILPKAVHDWKAFQITLQTFMCILANFALSEQHGASCDILNLKYTTLGNVEHVVVSTYFHRRKSSWFHFSYQRHILSLNTYLIELQRISALSNHLSLHCGKDCSSECAKSNWSLSSCTQVPKHMQKVVQVRFELDFKSLNPVVTTGKCMTKGKTG